MTDADLFLWDCKAAPAKPRHHVPPQYANGWLAYIPRGSAFELIEHLFSLCDSHDGAILRFESEDGGIVLGLHAPIPPPQNGLPESELDLAPQSPRRARPMIRTGGRFDPSGFRGC
jgi:hypothetical protein